MPTKLNAAQRSHRRKELVETARDAMSDGRPDNIVALLVEAEKARPTYNPEPLRPEVRAAVEASLSDWMDEQYGRIDKWEKSADDEASPEWTRKKLAETFTRRTNLDVFTGAFLTPAEPPGRHPHSPGHVTRIHPGTYLSPDEPLVVTRYTGHGIQHTAEQLPSLHGVNPWAGAR